jgi:isoaspartyl peptidase/L-asparaginase-like protein (Ntn-hydrolase superfamily)
VARGITLASLVAFVKGGNNVDDTQDLLAIIKSLTTAMQAMVQGLQYIQNALEIVEQRVQVLENER